jgi:hypothetical protein
MPTTDDPRAYCSRCGDSTPHTTTLWGLKTEVCGQPRPVHWPEKSTENEGGGEGVPPV